MEVRLSRDISPQDCAGRMNSPPPDEVWLFAQALLGNSVPTPTEPMPHVMADHDYAEWIAAIAPALEGRWDAAKHPRGGFSQNRGWFSPTTGSGLVRQPPRGTELLPAEPVRMDRAPRPFFTVSDRAKKQGPPGDDSASSAPSPPGSKPSDGSRSRNPAPRENGKLNKDDLLTYFKLLYGEQGQKLLKAFGKSGRGASSSKTLGSAPSRPSICATSGDRSKSGFAKMPIRQRPPEN